MPETDDLYEILQVHPLAETDVIVAAYRKLASKYHPDINTSPEATAVMTRLNLAYDILSNPAKRAAYDRERGPQSTQRPPHPTYTTHRQEEGSSRTSPKTTTPGTVSPPESFRQRWGALLVIGVVASGMALFSLLDGGNDTNSNEGQPLASGGGGPGILVPAGVPAPTRTPLPAPRPKPTPTPIPTLRSTSQNAPPTPRHPTPPVRIPGTGTAAPVNAVTVEAGVSSTSKPVLSATPTATPDSRPTEAPTSLLEASTAPADTGYVFTFPESQNQRYGIGTVVTLVAHCTHGFSRWFGDVPRLSKEATETPNRIAVVMNRDRFVIAICKSKPGGFSLPAPTPTPPGAPGTITSVPTPAPTPTPTATATVKPTATPTPTTTEHDAGWDLILEGRFQEAITKFDEAIRLNPEFFAAYYNRGEAYIILAQYQRAIQDFDEAIRLNPEHIDSYQNRGVAYVILAQYQRAIEDFDEAIRLDSEEALAYANRARANTWLHKDIEAQEDVDRAIELGFDGDVLRRTLDDIKRQR